MVKQGGDWKITVYHNVDVKSGVTGAGTAISRGPGQPWTGSAFHDHAILNDARFSRPFASGTAGVVDLKKEDL
jgi:hypothetical protein